MIWTLQETVFILYFIRGQFYLGTISNAERDCFFRKAMLEEEKHSLSSFSLKFESVRIPGNQPKFRPE